MGGTEKKRREYDIKMYLEETEDKGTYTSSSTGTGCDPVGGRRWTHESLQSSAEIN